MVQLAGLLDAERHAGERFRVLRDEALLHGTVVNGPQLAQVEGNGVGLQALTQQEPPEVVDGPGGQLLQQVAAFARELAEGGKGGLVGGHRAELALAPKLLDLHAEEGMHETVVVAFAEAGGDVGRPERTAQPFQLPDYPAHLVETAAQVVVDRGDIRPVALAAPAGNSHGPPTVELVGTQAVRREDHRPLAAVENLNDQGERIAGSVLTDVEHGADTCF